MKKFLSGLIAAFLLSAGFVAVTAETASAACKPSRYVPCPASSASQSKAPNTVKKGKKAKVKVVISAQRGSGIKPKGVATVTIKGPGVKKTYRVTINGSAKNVTSPAFKKKGVYTVTIVFKGTNVRDSKKTLKIRVK